MIKDVIAPIQAWLLSQGRCVGCSTPLLKGRVEKHKLGTKVTCKCGRIYIKDKAGRFRRALVSEV
ncbi:hypothetical protein A2803_04370 [Candidatus Woesebacteria bacterium RIFCSPHIGHO2_01_FULL_44_21]|uniref:Uncharacterized protein n=1 Tax=Candidatus Woesebacteria bacterium RIFCSPHIGHO2_01_FULL_44_21 TaxID=1802503 RepID=A0A1F7Z3Q6_9BACT|nr:MAG: hypothetical protein A2803_04370 [Candidatus Woesebacteria bacterium RIFCSPHIGHO2_01_FULL_44_21]OGM71502.1 MAG: hypothetical protein A2897_04255 [Candidatus Woesebacteria bacterium RIFCSPLOWO2_01_FULL_44_24b]